MKKTIFILSLIFLVSFASVLAVTQDELAQAKALIDSRANCSSLNSTQLEIIGEYYLEQMHPGAAHEAMDRMMGFDQNPTVDEQFHIGLAKTFYCGEQTGLAGYGYGMMSGSAIGYGYPYGMMGGGAYGQCGMMSGYGYGYGMMGNYWGGYGWSFTSVLYLVLLIALIVIAVLVIVKLLRNLGEGRK